MAQDFPTVDGIAPSWADIKVSLTPDGGSILEVIDIAGIKTDEKVEVGEQKAPNGRIIAFTTGAASYECSITLYKSGLRKLMKALMALAPTEGNQVKIGLVPFDILIQHTPPGETEIYERKIKRARYMGNAGDFKEGTEPDQAEVPLKCFQIVDIINGKEVVAL